jgi:hypothetical protein
MTGEDLDRELVDRLRKSIARAIADECRTPESVVMIRYPEAVEALLGVLIALSGELALFDDVHQVHDLAAGISTRIMNQVPAARAKAHGKPDTTPLIN